MRSNYLYETNNLPLIYSTEADNNFQIVFAYTDPFLLEFPELELFLFEELLKGNITRNHRKVYIDIYSEPTSSLLNVSFNRTEVENKTVDDLMEYDISQVYTSNEVTTKYDYIDVLSNFDGIVHSLNVIVPVSYKNDRIGKVVMLIHPSNKKQVISICGEADMMSSIDLLV